MPTAIYRNNAEDCLRTGPYRPRRGREAVLDQPGTIVAACWPSMPPRETQAQDRDVGAARGITDRHVRRPRIRRGRFAPPRGTQHPTNSACSSGQPVSPLWRRMSSRPRPISESRTSDRRAISSGVPPTTSTPRSVKALRTPDRSTVAAVAAMQRGDRFPSASPPAPPARARSSPRSRENPTRRRSGPRAAPLCA